MKRDDLIKALRDVAADRGTSLVFVRHGGGHDVYRIGGYQFSVPRHREINEITAKSILREAKR